MNFLKGFAFLGRMLDSRINHEDLERYYETSGETESALLWHGLLGILAFTAITTIGVNLLIRFMASSNPPVPVMAYRNDDLKVARELKNYDRPFASSLVIKNWSYNAVLSIFTQDFLNYKKQQEESRIWFTPESYDAFYGSFVHSHIFLSMTKSSLRVTAVPLDQPRIASIKSYRKGKLIAWNVLVPVLLVYDGATNTKKVISEKVLVNMIVISLDPSTNHAGLGLQSMSLDQYAEK